MSRREGVPNEQPWESMATLVREEIPADVSDAIHAAGRARLVRALQADAPQALDGRRAPLRLSRAGRLWVALAAATLSLAAALFVLRGLSAPLTFKISGVEPPPGVPAPTGDSAYLQLPPEAPPANVSFSDGSRVVVEAATSARIGSVTSKGATLVLEGGQLELDIVHRKSTEWTVQAGPYSIAVTGTRFQTHWQNGELTVTMDKGSVVVKGPLATGGVAVIGGQTLTVRQRDGVLSIVDQSSKAPTPSAEPVLPVDSAAPSTLPRAQAPPQATPVTPRREGPSWSSRVATGDYATVLRDADEAGIDVVLARRPVADLAALADAARYGHRNDLARRTLQTERSRFPRASESRSAAFLLGRMAEESGDTREALSEYDTCLRESPDGALAQEALGRKLGVLRQNKSDGAEARSAASEYLRRFPTGPYAHIAEEMTRGP